MANKKSQTMNGARNAWANLVENPTVENLNTLRAAFKKAGASWKSFSEMQTPMPQTFPGRYLNSNLTDDAAKKSLKIDFGPNGEYAKLSRTHKAA